MTEQELYDSYQFKLIKKILKREFKWIKDVKIDGDPNRFTRLIFLELIIDPFELAEEEGLEVASYIKKNRPDFVMYLSVFFKEDRENPILSNLIRELDDVVENTSKNPAIPQELKLDSSRLFSIGKFTYLG